MPVAAAIIGAGALGAGASIFGASQAASAQKKAAAQAAAVQREMYQRQREDLMPYMTAGGNAILNLTERLPELTSPIEMNQAELEKTPGYKFIMSQGLKGIQNSASARGLGNSGAALKGAGGYMKGLANSTYLDQFNLANTNRTNAYNRLMGVAQLGQGSAAGVGASGMQAATNVGSAYTNAGNATAGAYMAGAGAVNNFTNLVGGLAYQGLYGPPQGSGGGGGPLNLMYAGAGYR